MANADLEFKNLKDAVDYVKSTRLNGCLNMVCLFNMSGHCNLKETIISSNGKCLNEKPREKIKLGD